MKNIKLYLTLSLAVLSMNYAVAIDKQSCEDLTYDPAGVASDPHSLVPTKTIAPKYKFCSGKMAVGDSEAIGSGKIFHVDVTSAADDTVCKKITAIISNDKADLDYLNNHKQFNFHACLKPRDVLRLKSAANSSVTIGDISQSITRTEKRRLIIKLYGFNESLARIIHRNKINQIFINENDKDDNGNDLVFPEDSETCSMKIINNLVAYQGFMADEFLKLHPGSDPMKCGDFLDGTYMVNPFNLPHYKDKFHKTVTKEEPEELIQAIAGRYVPQVVQYPNFKPTIFEKLGKKFTWKEFLDKALGSPYSDKLEVVDGYKFRLNQ